MPAQATTARRVTRSAKLLTVGFGPAALSMPSSTSTRSRATRITRNNFAPSSIPAITFTPTTRATRRWPNPSIFRFLIRKNESHRGFRGLRLPPFRCCEAVITEACFLMRRISASTGGPETRNSSDSKFRIQSRHHEHLDERHSAWALRAGFANWRGRHGRSLESAGHTSRSHRGSEETAGSVQQAVRAGSAHDRGAEPSAYLPTV